MTTRQIAKLVHWLEAKGFDLEHIIDCLDFVSDNHPYQKAEKTEEPKPPVDNLDSGSNA